MKYCPRCGGELRRVDVRHTFFICDKCGKGYALKGDGHFFKDLIEVDSFDELPGKEDVCDECEIIDSCTHVGFRRDNCRTGGEPPFIAPNVKAFTD